MTNNESEGADEVSSEKEKLRSLASSIAPTTTEESAAITTNVREVLRAREWRIVLTFMPMPGEVDLGDLRNDPGLTFAVTRTPRTGPLTIHSLEEPLERHPFGYLQPRPDANPIAPDGIEVVLVPGLLFARDGGRLGHGKGYYDKLLSSFHPRPYLIGATVDRRVVDRLPMTHHDVWMDALATET
ncbi:MAG TPA: 5-formyltetrahydrofolate cyclo-ligase, partial [Acidimicrobiia bacterium]|nr:5-formyltetrahydrofolate cyclo-ligase [Acidimicrobiia bacterium]